MKKKYESLQNKDDNRQSQVSESYFTSKRLRELYNVNKKKASPSLSNDISNVR